jgi:CRP-like cAMP-binding protein
MIKNEQTGEIRRFFKGQADFENLCSSEMDQMIQTLRLKKIRRNEWIFDQGEDFDRIYFLKKGHVRLFSMNEEGETGYLSFLTPKTMFPLQGVLTGKTYCYNAKAVGDVELYVMPIEEIRRIIIHNYAFTMTYMKRMEQIMYRSEKNLERKTSSNANQRVRQVIAGLNEDYAQIKGDKKQIPFKVFLKDLAVMSGTTTETAGTVVKEMKKRNEILYNKKIISFYNC